VYTVYTLKASRSEAPSFTAKEAARLGVGAAALARYAKKGDLERLSRGIYRSPSAPTIDNFRWEDLFAATRSVKGGVVCLISALAIYDLTEAIPRQHWIAVDHSTRHRANNSVRVVRMRNIKLGRTEIDLGGFTLPIFDRERTIVDAFRALDRETAIKALEFALATKKLDERINMEKLWRYAKELRVQIEPYVLAVTT
jgi:predicted transcriptional regulator of viral defense system